MLNTLNPPTDDRVNGYTLYEIEMTLNESRSLSDWEKRLRDKFENPTEQFLTNLFNSLTSQ